jgi:hypothetical protein
MSLFYARYLPNQTMVLGWYWGNIFLSSLGHQAQSAGDSIAPVAYLSKQLDYIYRG